MRPPRKKRDPIFFNTPRICIELVEFAGGLGSHFIDGCIIRESCFFRVSYFKKQACRSLLFVFIVGFWDLIFGSWGEFVGVG